MSVRGIASEVPVVETVEDQYDEEEDDEPLEISREEILDLHKNMKSSETQDEGERTQGFSIVTDKAVKADDAVIPLHLWNDRIALGLQEL